MLSDELIELGKKSNPKALELAAENAEAIEGWNTGFSGNTASVDKYSTINTIKQIE